MKAVKVGLSVCGRGGFKTQQSRDIFCYILSLYAKGDRFSSSDN